MKRARHRRIAALATICSMAFSFSAFGQTLLHTKGREIVDAQGRSVALRGFNLGGAFIMEPYMSPMDRIHRIRDTYTVQQTLERRFGRATANQLMAVYQTNWTSDQDIARIAAAGYNVVRIPFWWGQFLDIDNPTPSGWREDGFVALDRLVEACRRNGIYAILDMHGVIGGQSDNPYSGQENQNRFWKSRTDQAKTVWLWRKIAAHYRNNPTVAGYDLLNEPAPPAKTGLRKILWPIYRRFYHNIRSVDPDHIIFVEDTFGTWSLDMLPPPKRFGWRNVVYESHFYAWPERHPGMSQATAVKNITERNVADFERHAVWNVPGYIGEFNALSTDPHIWRDLIGRLDRAHLSWTIWSYKSATGLVPDAWGYLDPSFWPERPDPATDTAETIQHDWEGWNSQNGFKRNPTMDIP
ncbi:glycoside hydrolase family 5 protein [Kozakia baliensis]|uniref:Uncharacterized protein n=1 Tax=Kozakia baliensis TaxID=153496 RepID=A0A1D8US05_9PROT|nr:cellulase family glycosylhydrolase [Kozakia baliensis]AOX16429.1 hypothetical protein A0U89_04025 [Kozakia baliensis]GBR28965.1 cellulase [Kozakia baliensis NRIC 0488]GEL63490.1 hypothetical protein KBA01_07760 [Kozakia baliensis]